MHQNRVQKMSDIHYIYARKKETKQKLKFLEDAYKQSFRLASFILWMNKKKIEIYIACEGKLYKFVHCDFNEMQRFFACFYRRQEKLVYCYRRKFKFFRIIFSTKKNTIFPKKSFFIHQQQFFLQFRLKISYGQKIIKMQSCL